MVESFSGQHPFRPAHLREAMKARWSPWTEQAEDAVAELVSMIDSNRCPRCGRRLPSLPEYPAGSRETDCRCIPICGPCGTHEGWADVGYEATGIFWYPVEYWYWTPPEPHEVDWENEHVMTRFRTIEAIVQPHGEDAMLLSSEGVTNVSLKATTGGWAQYGFDDPEEDEEEGRGR